MERRRHPRLAVSHPVLYSTDIVPRPKPASTLNLSMGGAAIETSYSLQRGERLEISIGIRSKVIKCRSRVVYTLRGDGDRLMAGVKFEEISEEDSLYLKEYISSVMDRRDQTSAPSDV